jgi:glycine/D-amino acid oxidase-like deaminating enzyme
VATGDGVRAVGRDEARPDARSHWEASASPDLLAALDPGPAALPRTCDVLVVGGGIVGLAAAVACREAGLGRVALVERERLAAGPSGSAAGGLTPGLHEVARPPAFGALARRGLEIHRERDDPWGLGLVSLDLLLVSAERIAAETVDVPGAEALDGDAAREVEPALGEVGAALRVPGQAWADPVRLAAAHARRAGAVATRVAATAVETRGGRVVRVETTAGRVSPGALVVATGTAPGLLPDLPAALARTVKGHLLVTEPVPLRLRVGVVGSILVLQLPDGRLVAGGTFEPDDDSPAVRPEAVEAIRAEVARLLPAAAGTGVERAWCCFRPASPDDLPVIDRAPGAEDVYASLGHFRTGLLVAPAAGEALASWIATGRRPEALAAFGLDRLEA